MEALPEVRAAAARLAAIIGEGPDLVEMLGSVSATAEALIPSCVGVSMTFLVGTEPFTVTATSPEIEALDASQYLHDGPCMQSARSGEQVSVPDVLDEQAWHLFAQASAAHGVRATLSIPLRRADWTVCGALNLYAGDVAAFRESDALVAALLGVYVAGAVSNADLSFLTRERARALPQQLADRSRVDEAVGVMMGARGVSEQEARGRIERAATGAGVSLATAAGLVIAFGT